MYGMNGSVGWDGWDGWGERRSSCPKEICAAQDGQEGCTKTIGDVKQNSETQVFRHLVT